MTSERPVARTGAVRNERGVTLIELMVVVAIISIIAAIAMVVIYQDVTAKSRIAADFGTVASLRSAVAIYYSRKDGNFPPDQPVLETLVLPSPPIFQCPGQSYTYDPTNGVITLAIVTASNC